MIPKESAWFGSEAENDRFDTYGDAQKALARTVGEVNKTIIPMRLQPLYKEDWIGLRTLDENGRVVFEACAGEHMEMGECWEALVRQYVGG